MTEIAITTAIAIGLPALGFAVQWGIIKSRTNHYQSNIDSLWEKKAEKETVNAQFDTVSKQLIGIEQKLDLYINMTSRTKIK